MVEADTENGDTNESIDFDYSEVEDHVTNLHDTLDEIKESGERLGNQLGEALSEIDVEDREKHERLLRRAFLLYERVEKGDRAVVRGE